jgi:selenocysteine lyase/cysteine desulfurase
MSETTPNETQRLDALAAREFPVRHNQVYLNHAAISPWPDRARKAMRAFADDLAENGSLHYGRWQQTDALLRRRLRDLVGAASTDDIALVANTSVGLSLVAEGLNWHPGDNVVISDSEFPSNRMVWEALEDRGVTVREAPCTGAGDCARAVLERVDHRTRVVSLSSVQFGTGVRPDLARIGAELAGTRTAFCVDAIQSLGAFPLDAQAIGADFVTADGHKWMLGPEGLGVFYCAPEWRPHLRLHQWGWHMAEPFGDFDARQWRPTTTARRFEAGTPNTPSAHAWEASLAVLQEAGIEAVAQRITARVDYLDRALADLPGVEFVTPRDPDSRGGILTVRFGEHTGRVYHALRANGVTVLPRAGGIRFAPHFYNGFDELDRVAAIAARALGAG